ncbi:MAG: type I methionyl aminopeptidase [Gemmatimonadetes bacterium]|nr:type I methionyl aminopeptidase [Gemmatimonadota bacterium]
MSIETEDDLRGMEAAGAAVAETLRVLRPLVRPGVTTAELDALAAETLARRGARSAPRLVYDFPGTICISVNDEAVHGVPGPRQLRPGDLVTLDVTAELDGYFADAAVTIPVPPVSLRATRLVEAAEAAFWRGADVARAGTPLREVGRAVEREVRGRGFRVLRDLCGHGIGRSIHEPPSVLNYYDPRDRTILSDGLVLALEPIIATSTERTRLSRDGWTIRSADGGLAAHFEHTLVVGPGAPLILTAA